MATKVAFTSLGCAKNLIDSEIMIGHLRKAGMAITPDPKISDVVIINTCSFIHDAKVESINSIKEAIEMRSEERSRSGKMIARNRKVIVAGCLSQRFATELPKLMPEVDAFIGLDQLKDIAAIVNGVMLKTGGSMPESHISKKLTYIPDYDTPRYRLTPSYSAYVKIAEGCNHNCTFCIIPKIRGMHRSRTQESVVREVEQLVKEGVREINLISQDTTYFGMDRWESERPNKRSKVDSGKGESLASLIRELDKIEGDFWIRLLYTHPAHWSDELIAAMAKSKKVARYVDIPLQHISDKMLSAMQRETDGAYIRNLIKRIRKGIPGVAVRSAFIVGFPGESEADFEELMEFLDEAKLDRVGIFQYSREEGTRAYNSKKQVHHATKKRRWNAAMQLLQELAVERNKQMIGQSMRVLVEGNGLARSEGDAPDIDGMVFVRKSLPAGSFADVKIKNYRDYDLIAE